MINIVKNICAVTLLSFLFACTNKQPVNHNGQLVLKDSIIVNCSEEELKILTRGGDNLYVENDSEQYLLVTNKKVFQTDKIDLKKNKGKITRLSNMDSVLKKYEINGYYFHSPDSIIGMSWAIPRVLYLFDINGKIKRIWPFRKDSLTGIPALFYGGEYYSHIQCNIAKGDIYFVTNTPIMPYVTPAKYYSYNHFACIGLDKDSAYVKYHFGNWPQMYQDKNYGMTGSCYSMTLFDGICWVSFCKSDSLYGYKNGKLVSTESVSSPYVHQSNKYFDTTKEGDYDYIGEYCYEQSDYYYTLSDPNGTYLYRIADHENGKYFNKDSTTNRSIDKPWSIIVADKKMNTVAEKTFDGGKLNITSIYATPKGVWIKGLAKPNKYYYYEVVL